MVKNNSKWKVVLGAGDVLEIDATGYTDDFVAPNPAAIEKDFDIAGSEAVMSPDQEMSLQNQIEVLRKYEQEKGPVDNQELIGVLRSDNAGLDENEAQGIVEKYRKQYPSQAPEQIQDTTPPAEMFPEPVESQEYGGPNPPPIGPTVLGKYKGKYKKNKTKKHLKGKGPKAEKANEIYHAIMREKGKAEPTKEEQASAAAIAWSQAKKVMKKKAYFRGEEVKVLDSYRGMWGEELVRVSMNGQSIDVPRETLEFVSTEKIDPVAQLKDFVQNIPEDPDTRSQIKASIANLKIAKDIAYRLIVESSEDLSGSDEISIDSIHVSCENKIQNLEQKLLTAHSDQDKEYLQDLPKYEMGKEIISSGFSRDSDGWMDEVIEKMAAEAEGIDIEKLANEDPIVFVNSLSDDIIGDAPSVKRLAMERVSEAAGPLDEESKQMVIARYIEKTENVRRNVFSSRKQSNAQQIQEQQEAIDSTPDEGLFL